MSGYGIFDDQLDSSSSRNQLIQIHLLSLNGECTDFHAFWQTLLLNGFYHSGVHCHCAADSEELEVADREIKKVLLMEITCKSTSIYALLFIRFGILPNLIFE